MGCAMEPQVSPVAVFFYGLLMDQELLRCKGVAAFNPRIARLQGYRLSISSRATLVPAPHESVYGVLMQVPAEDLRRLYSEPDLSAYRPEAVRVVLDDGGGAEEAVCYNLPLILRMEDTDRGYARELYRLAKRLGLPDQYLESIEQGSP